MDTIPVVAHELHINVEFQVPGHILQPEFEGVRTGYFSKKESTLKVQVALPEQPPDDVDAFLVECLDASLDAVARWAEKRRRDVDLSPARRLVESL